MMGRHYEYPKAEGVVVCGDVHGKFDELVYRVVTLCGMTDTLVIVAGDCGFGFHRRAYYDQVFERVVPKLERANCWVVFVRGNHDNPAYFDGEEISNERWRAVGDYSTVTACGMNILCVGGATSVDRFNREDYRHPFVAEKGEWGQLPDKVRSMLIEEAAEVCRLRPADFWPDEQPNFDGEALQAIKDAGIGIDAVVSHVPPSMCEDVTPPSWLSYLIENDPTLPDDMRRDRETMDALLERLRQDGHLLRHWLYGHYHHSWQADIDGIRYTMLKEMEMKELVNTDYTNLHES